MATPEQIQSRIQSFLSRGDQAGAENYLDSLSSADKTAWLQEQQRTVESSSLPLPIPGAGGVGAAGSARRGAIDTLGALGVGLSRGSSLFENEPEPPLGFLNSIIANTVGSQGLRGAQNAVFDRLESGGSLPAGFSAGQGGSGSEQGLVQRLMSPPLNLTEQEAQQFIQDNGSAAALDLVLQAEASVGASIFTTGGVAYRDNGDGTITPLTGAGAAGGFGGGGGGGRAPDPFGASDRAEDTRRFDLGFGEDTRQFDLGLGEDARQFDANQGGLDRRATQQETGANFRAGLGEEGANQRARLSSATSGFQSINQLAPQLGQLALDNANFTKDTLRNPSDFIARAFFQRGQDSPLPQISQADIINQLRGNIGQFNSTLEGFNTDFLNNPQFNVAQPPVAPSAPYFPGLAEAQQAPAPPVAPHFNPPFARPPGFTGPVAGSGGGQAGPAVAQEPSGFNRSERPGPLVEQEIFENALQPRDPRQISRSSGLTDDALAEGGFTRAPVFAVGEEASGKLGDSGEIVLNPTQAPLPVISNDDIPEEVKRQFEDGGGFRHGTKGFPGYRSGTAGFSELDSDLLPGFASNNEGSGERDSELFGQMLKQYRFDSVIPGFAQGTFDATALINEFNSSNKGAEAQQSLLSQGNLGGQPSAGLTSSTSNAGGGLPPAPSASPGGLPAAPNVNEDANGNLGIFDAESIANQIRSGALAQGSTVGGSNYTLRPDGQLARAGNTIIGGGNYGRAPSSSQTFNVMTPEQRAQQARDNAEADLIGDRGPGGFSNGFGAPQLPTQGPVAQGDLVRNAKNFSPPGVRFALGEQSQLPFQQFGFAIPSPNRLLQLTASEREALNSRLAVEFNTTYEDLLQASINRFGGQTQGRQQAAFRG